MENRTGINKLGKISMGEMSKISLCTAMLCISSYIAFPIPFTPIMITAQTILVNLMALLLSPLQAALSILMFILLGAIGLPVFAGGNGGIGTLVGPTGGFILGFLFSVVGIGLLKGKKVNFIRYLILTIFIGMPITYLFGAIHMSYVLDMDYIKTVQVAILPFLVGDMIKAIIASLISVRLNRIYRS